MKYPKIVQAYIYVLLFSGFLIGFQAYLMARSWILIPLMFFIPYGLYQLASLWKRHYLKRRKGARLVRIIFVGFHFLPLILQLATIITPGIDRVILATMGLILYEASS
ncbi:MAG: hypothetical protein KC535_02995 [Nanoarchaeota archaeon]|nr:hypothetical protein [Nanoarchaeota archaeon]